jgi:predicted nucleic acid-binding Zn ribbon protein
MIKNHTGYHEYKRPNDEPFAASGITVFSYLTENTGRRTFSVEGLPSNWPMAKCPVCGGRKRRQRQACKPCYQKIRRVMVPLTCSYCGTHFERIVSEYDKSIRRGHVDVYCRKACSQAHHAIKNHRRCVVCDKPTPKKSSKYCSKECRAVRRVKELEPKVCSICATKFHPASYRTAYCSRPCANKAHSRRMRGAGNSHYKTGTSYANWFREMRPVILERDQYACAVCGKTEKLVVHHVDHIPKYNVAHNLITLCPTCHAVHHKSKVSPFPWLRKLALSRKMSTEQIMKSVELEARYYVRF